MLLKFFTTLLLHVAAEVSVENTMLTWRSQVSFKLGLFGYLGKRVARCPFISRLVFFASSTKNVKGWDILSQKSERGKENMAMIG